MPLQTNPYFSKIRQSIARWTKNLAQRNYLMTTDRLQKIGFDPQQVDLRLQQVNSEWSVERALMAHAAIVCIGGIALGKTVHKRYLLLPAAVGGFLMQYALTGWSPPFQILSTFGFRTSHDIEFERNALRALRGDSNDQFSPDSELANCH